jgi:tetratricopeptide (TPR) repeat protein
MIGAMMFGAIRRMMSSHHPREIYDRAAQSDQAFFAAQYVPLVGFAMMDGGIPLILLSQTQLVRELDADHAIIVPGEGGPRVFGTERGVSIMSGQPIHMFCELDLGTGMRAANFGEIEVPTTDAAAIARALGAKAMEIVGTRTSVPAGLPKNHPMARATEALEKGDFTRAALELDRAGRAAEATDPKLGAQIYRQLAALRISLRDAQGALEACDRAFAIVPPSENVEAFITRGHALDELGLKTAAQAWRDASRWAADPSMKLGCDAHAAGAALRHERAPLPPELVGRREPHELATILAAIGDSAGKDGNGYLAQAAWMVFNIDGLYTPSNVASIELLAQRVGLTSESAYHLTALVLLRMLATKDAPDTNQRAIAFVDRVANARGMARDALIAFLSRDNDPFTKIDFALRSLAARTPWLVST